MLYTTFRLLKDAGACQDKYSDHVAHHVAEEVYGWDTPIPLTESLEWEGLDSAIWALRCTTKPEKAQNFLIEFACRCAEHTLINFESVYPDDKRPRQAIEAARKYITDKSPAARLAESAARSAESAARSAARSAAWSARSAARSAAWSAESAARSAESARSAAWSARSAARSAAWSAESAGSAEQKWQSDEFLKMAIACDCPLPDAPEPSKWLDKPDSEGW